MVILSTIALSLLCIALLHTTQSKKKQQEDHKFVNYQLQANTLCTLKSYFLSWIFGCVVFLTFLVVLSFLSQTAAIFSCKGQQAKNCTLTLQSCLKLFSKLQIFRRWFFFSLLPITLRHRIKNRQEKRNKTKQSHHKETFTNVLN